MCFCNLRNMAIDMGNEIDAQSHQQNRCVNRINVKAACNEERIAKALKLCSKLEASSHPQYPAHNIKTMMGSFASKTKQIFKGNSEVCYSSSSVFYDDQVLEIISLQNFDRSWDFTDHLQRCLETDGKALKMKFHLLDDKVIATILTISFLEKTYINRRDEWSIIVDKATVWLETQNLQGNSVEQVKQMVMSSL